MDGDWFSKDNIEKKKKDEKIGCQCSAIKSTNTYCSRITCKCHKEGISCGMDCICFKKSQGRLCDQEFTLYFIPSLLELSITRLLSCKLWCIVANLPILPTEIRDLIRRKVFEVINFKDNSEELPIKLIDSQTNHEVPLSIPAQSIESSQSAETQKKKRATKSDKRSMTEKLTDGDFYALSVEELKDLIAKNDPKSKHSGVPKASLVLQVQRLMRAGKINLN